MKRFLLHPVFWEGFSIRMGISSTGRFRKDLPHQDSNGSVKAHGDLKREADIDVGNGSNFFLLGSSFEVF